MFGICVAIGQFCIVCHFEMSEKLFSGCMTSLKCRSMQKMGKKTCKHFLCIFVWTIIPVICSCTTYLFCFWFGNLVYSTHFQLHIILFMSTWIHTCFLLQFQPWRAYFVCRVYMSTQCIIMKNLHCVSI